ncbi:MAG: nucleotide modification associated domain-containing protein [Streptococcus parasanguinis]|nr:nucleotide modification associated domain-containing protein [Streptococcus parasanguinis]
MTKLNPTTMKTQYDGQYDTFCRKNHDYGNSFEESLDKFGIIASLVRMQDKMLRLQSLTDESKTQQVGSESLLDTLEDLSNYAAMTACWLKGVRAEDDVINKSYHAVKDLIETCDNSDVKYDELFRKRMLNSLYGVHIFRTPGENWKMTQCDNGFNTSGAEIETELPEETIGMYIDRMLSELYSRIDVWGYNDQEQYHEFVNFAETTVKEIIKNNVPISELQKHIDVFPNFSQAYKNSLKSRCMKEYNKVEQVHPNIEDETYDFLEEQVTRAVEYMAHIRAHGRAPQNKDIGDYAYDIARYALEQYPDPYRIIQHMGQILAMRSLNPNDALLFCSRVTYYIRDINNKEKCSNMAKAKDKARGVVMKGSRGNSNVIVMSSRGSGKGLMKTKSLLEELGVPKEDIKEIFEGLEDNDEE